MPLTTRFRRVGCSGLGLELWLIRGLIVAYDFGSGVYFANTGIITVITIIITTIVINISSCSYHDKT